MRPNIVLLVALAQLACSRPHAATEPIVPRRPSPSPLATPGRAI